MKTQQSWFYYSLLAVVFWSVWAILSKIASVMIPSMMLQLLFTLGNTLVMVVLLLQLKLRVGKNRFGILYGLLSGAFAGLGNIALYEAFRRGGPASIVIPLSALYPLVTILLAGLILKERLNARQRAGIFLAVLAISVFSI